MFYRKADGEHLLKIRNLNPTIAANEAEVEWTPLTDDAIMKVT